MLCVVRHTGRGGFNLFLYYEYRGAVRRILADSTK